MKLSLAKTITGIKPDEKQTNRKSNPQWSDPLTYIVDVDGQLKILYWKHIQGSMFQTVPQTS